MSALPFPFLRTTDRLPLATASDIGPIIGWSLLLIVALVSMFMAIVVLKRWMNKEDGPAKSAGFTLGDLRRLHQQGKMSDEEYEKARAQMIAATQRAAERAAQAALEASKARSGATDVDVLRAKAQRNREQDATPEPRSPPDDLPEKGPTAH